MACTTWTTVNAEQNPGYAVINTIIWNVEVDSAILLANCGFFLTSEGEFFIVGAA